MISALLAVRPRGRLDRISGALRLALRAVRTRGRDELTGLGTRAHLVEQGPAMVALARRRGRPLALLMFDLDGFKQVNDTWGHLAGDRVLVEVARRARTAVVEGDLLVRLGGDEFALLTGPLGSEREAEVRAERLLAAVSGPVAVEGVEVAVTASLGLALLGKAVADLEALRATADRAMYAAKAAGPGSWRAGRSAEVPVDTERPGLREELPRAIAEGELVLHYQPQVDVRTGVVTGFEALVRWQHPELGLLPPDAFLALARSADLLEALTARVLEIGLTDLPQLRDLAPDATLALNVSVRQLLGTGSFAGLPRRLEDAGLHAQDLVLEITEPAPRPTTEVLELLADLDRRGLGVSIHGFGSAHSSLTTLWRTPAVREVKVDPALVNGAVGDPEAARLVGAVVSAAHGLDIRVVAAGVESGAAVVRMRDLGCDTVQGHWVSPARPLVEVAAWTRSWPEVRGARLAL